MNISLSPFTPENFGLARPSHPAPAFLFSILRLNLVLTHGRIAPDFRGGAH